MVTRGKKFILIYGPITYNRLFHKYNYLDSDYAVMHPGDTKLPGYVKWGENVALVVFTGGTDVNPKMYGAKKHKKTSAPDVSRDIKEECIYNTCRRHNIPMVGICRGAQLLNVLNGGKLIQHVENHGVNHKMILTGAIDVDGIDPMINVTSTHHQMMVPADGHKLVGYAINQAFNGKQVEPEVVVYDKTKSYCFQYHPEFMDEDTQGRKFFDAIVEKEIINAAR